MNRHSSDDRRSAVPDRWHDPILGVLAVLGGLASIVAGSIAIVGAVRIPVGSIRYFQNVTSPAGYFVGYGLIAMLYVLVGVGGTRWYLAVRDFEPGFVVEVPDGEDVRWLVGAVVGPPVLVGLGFLVEGYRGGPELFWTIPDTVLVVPSATLVAPGLPLEVQMLVGILALGVVPGVALGMLVHGVLQRSLRRGACTPVALAVVALLVGATPVWWEFSRSAILLAAFSAYLGYGYDRTDSLLVPAVGYGVLNGTTLVVRSVVMLLMFRP